MSISFSKSLKDRLQREITALEAEIKVLQKKQQQAESTLKNLKRDSQKSATPSDLNNKLARINKLNKELPEYAKKHAMLSQQLSIKKADLTNY